MVNVQPLTTPGDRNRPIHGSRRANLGQGDRHPRPAMPAAGGLLLGLVIASTATLAAFSAASNEARAEDPWRKNAKPRGEAFYLNYDWQKSHDKCIILAANQGNCGSCWTWAASRAYGERLCQQSHYGVRIWPSPYVIENCYGNRQKKVCSGGNTMEFAVDMSIRGNIPMTLYPGPPGYYSLPSDQAEQVAKDCQWGKSQISRKAVQTEPWLGIVKRSQSSVRAPAFGESRATFIRQMKDELSQHGPPVLTLTKIGSPACCFGDDWTTCSKEERPKCTGHAVVLHGWETKENGEMVWLCKNSWGTSFLPTWLQGEIDALGRTRIHERNILATDSFPSHTMIVTSFQTFVPDTDSYLAKVRLEAQCGRTRIAPEDADMAFGGNQEVLRAVKRVLPTCEEVYRPQDERPTAPTSKLSSFFSKLRHGGEEAAQERLREEQELWDRRKKKYDDCLAARAPLTQCVVKGTTPLVTFNPDSEGIQGQLNVRFRLRPAAGHCRAAEVARRTEGVTYARNAGCKKLDRDACEAQSSTKCVWKEAPWPGRTEPMVVHDQVIAAPKSKDRSATTMTASAQIFLPTFDPDSEFAAAQVLKSSHLEYFSIELLGWAYDSYNGPARGSDAARLHVRADGEGKKKEGAILRTTDVFLPSHYTDVAEACDLRVPMSAYCDGGQDRQCVTALGRYLDRYKYEAWVQKKADKSWEHKTITLETLHATGGSGACLHMGGEGTSQCVPVCGATVATDISTVRVEKLNFFSSERKCAGFDFVGPEGHGVSSSERTWEFCANDVTNKREEVTREHAVAAEDAQRMVCLAVRWAALKHSPMPDAQQPQGSGETVKCPWPGQYLTPDLRDGGVTGLAKHAQDVRNRARLTYRRESGRLMNQ